MAKQANTMMIGGFVVIAVFLLAASVAIFGSGKFFKQTDKYVLHFDRSIKGLNVGAPVLFQGVQIGSVTSIVMRTDQEKLTMNILVFIEIEPDRFQFVDKLKKRGDPKETLPKLINKGLRAVLTMQSFITGQLMIELDYFPNTPVRLSEIDSQYLEIPTIPSTTERLYQTLQNIDLESLVKHLENTLSGVDRMVNNPDLAEAIHSLRLTADALQQVISKIDANVAPIINNFEGTLSDTRTLINNVDRQVEPLASNLKKAINDFDNLTRDTDARLTSLTNNLEKSLAGFRGVLSEDAPLIIKLEETLQDISDMASSIRQLADYLEQHPEALIKGKENYGGQ